MQPKPTIPVSNLKMKNKFFIALALLTLPMITFSQRTLRIEIEGLRNSCGQMQLELKNEKEKQIKVVTKSISNNICIIFIEDIKSGKYGFRFFHDENNNEKLDVNGLGIPKEGFGYSNNPKNYFGPPSFNKTIFELTDSKIVKCKITYF